MTDYDSMSVHELMMEACDGGDLLPIESALRKAVIREASVGSCSIRYANAKRIDMDEIRIKSIFLEKNWERVWIDYDLIPKETP